MSLTDAVLYLFLAMAVPPALFEIAFLVHWWRSRIDATQQPVVSS